MIADVNLLETTVNLIHSKFPKISSENYYTLMNSFYSVGMIDKAEFYYQKCSKSNNDPKLRNSLHLAFSKILVSKKHIHEAMKTIQKVHAVDRLIQKSEAKLFNENILQPLVSNGDYQNFKIAYNILENDEKFPNPDNNSKRLFLQAASEEGEVDIAFQIYSQILADKLAIDIPYIPINKLIINLSLKNRIDDAYLVMKRAMNDNNSSALSFFAVFYGLIKLKRVENAFDALNFFSNYQDIIAPSSTKMLLAWRDLLSISTTNFKFFLNILKNMIQSGFVCNTFESNKLRENYEIWRLNRHDSSPSAEEFQILLDVLLKNIKIDSDAWIILQNYLDDCSFLGFKIAQSTCLKVGKILNEKRFHKSFFNWNLAITRLGHSNIHHLSECLTKEQKIKILDNQILNSIENGLLDKATLVLKQTHALGYSPHSHVIMKLFFSNLSSKKFYRAADLVKVYWPKQERTKFIQNAINYLIKIRNLPAAIEFMAICSERIHFEPSAQLFSNVLHNFVCSYDTIDQSLLKSIEYIFVLISFNTITPMLMESMIRVYKISHEVTKITEIFDVCRSRDIKLSNWGYYNLCQLFCKEKDTLNIFKLINYYKRANSQDIVFFNSILETFFHMGNFTDILKVYEIIKESKAIPDACSYEWMIKSHIELNHDLDAAEKLLHKLKNQNIIPREAHLLPLLNAYISKNDKESIVKIYELADDYGVILPSETRDDVKMIEAQ